MLHILKATLRSLKYIEFICLFFQCESCLIKNKNTNASKHINSM